MRIPDFFQFHPTQEARLEERSSHSPCLASWLLSVLPLIPCETKVLCRLSVVIVGQKSLHQFKFDASMLPSHISLHPAVFPCLLPRNRSQFHHLYLTLHVEGGKIIIINNMSSHQVQQSTVEQQARGPSTVSLTTNP